MLNYINKYLTNTVNNFQVIIAYQKVVTIYYIFITDSITVIVPISGQIFNLLRYHMILLLQFYYRKVLIQDR